MRNPVIARSHLRRSDDIFEHRAVLHRRYADHDRIILIDTGNIENPTANGNVYALAAGAYSYTLTRLRLILFNTYEITIESVFGL